MKDTAVVLGALMCDYNKPSLSTSDMGIQLTKYQNQRAKETILKSS